MYRALPVILFVLVGAGGISGCGPVSGGTGDGFTDGLTFGTGVTGTGFTLSGESEAFALATTPVVWFRLESSANFDGRFVRLYLNKLEQKDFAGCANPDAHLCLSQFSVSQPGTYNVDAYLVQTVIDIGKETFVASATLRLE